MAAIYNEIEPYAADWLENLIAAGLIAPGRVDRRSIRDLTPEDVQGPGQRHFFAGVSVWSRALRLAGWPDDLDVYSGSCPCQSWSQAGRQKGEEDERHLWPEWFRLISAYRPGVILGEQVASVAIVGKPIDRTGSSGDAQGRRPWLDIVRADLEAIGYIVGVTVIGRREGAEPLHEDERDRAIDGRATRAAYFMLLAGMIVVGMVMPFTRSGWDVVNAALLVIVLSESMRHVLIVVGYRRPRLAY